MHKLLEKAEINYFRTIAEKSFNALIIMDSEARIQFWNEAASSMFGFEEHEVDGKDFYDLLTPDRYRGSERESFDRLQRIGATEGSGQMVEIERLRKDGSEFWVDFSFGDLDVGGETWAFAIIRDADARKKRELELTLQARTDGLTGLANRREFQRLLESNLDRELTLAIIDIDSFKGLNDRFGHPVGDDVIQFVSSELLAHFGTAICVARLGGDEFGVLVESMDRESTQAQFEALRTKCRDHEPSGGQSFTISIGVAISSRPKKSARELLTFADKMLYRSKADGRDAINCDVL